MTIPRLFGTDGIRGRAGIAPLDAPTITRVGAAVVRVLNGGTGTVRLVVGRDTRESGAWIEQAFAAGAAGAGARLADAGVLPTPGIAFAAARGFDAGVVVSASHNPFEDNGIKVFTASGDKLPDALEREVEALVADPAWRPSPVAPSLPEPCAVADAYLAHLAGTLDRPARVANRRVVLDTAHGATFAVAPRLFRGLGLDVSVLHDAPDGRNINRGCGSTAPAALAEAVVARRADLGVAFDGDGDRAILVDRHGRVVDGDAVLLMCAAGLKAAGRLPGARVVASVMSNLGLELALEARGIGLVRCAVGDRFVRETMLAEGAALGGEQSGHIIFAEHMPTGDGMLTALQVLGVMADTGRDLADLAADFVPSPQVLVNVPVREKRPLEAVPAVAAALARVEARLGRRGRLLVRYSGTEPLLRIMIEGPDRPSIEAWAGDIADAVRQHLG